MNKFTGPNTKNVLLALTACVIGVAVAISIIVLSGCEPPQQGLSSEECADRCTEKLDAVKERNIRSCLADIKKVRASCTASTKKSGHMLAARCAAGRKAILASVRRLLVAQGAKGTSLHAMMKVLELTGVEAELKHSLGTNGHAVCLDVTKADCARDADLCDKIGKRVCYKIDDDPCKHDISLCPGKTR